MELSLEPLDLYKAGFALLAGLILGLERELKDKAAGIKTISVLCLGACLFTILSLKSGSEFTDGARIASYVVAGVGFLGAGVIFKDGFAVSGLTTASVIWIAAAIGMAIGYGQVLLAAIFLMACLLIIYTSRYLNLALFSGKTNKNLVMVLPQNSWQLKDQIIAQIRTLSYRLEERKLESHPDKLIVTLELMVVTTRLHELETFLIEEKHIERFEL